MKSQSIKPETNTVDAILSARCMSRLAIALRKSNKDSITPDELDQMAKIITQKAKQSGSINQNAD